MSSPLFILSVFDCIVFHIECPVMTINYVYTASVNLFSSILVLCRFGVICFLICKSFMKIKKNCSQDLKQNHYMCLPSHMWVSCLQTNAPINVNPVGGECGQGVGIWQILKFFDQIPQGGKRKVNQKCQKSPHPRGKNLNKQCYNTI